MLKGPCLGARDINDPVDDDMRHMNTLGPEFTGERLCQGTEGKFS